MIRCDGVFVIYKIQHLQADGVWTGSNLDHFGTPHVTGKSSNKMARTGWSTTNGFSACGDCWQQTGATGTFDLNAAAEALVWISEKWPDYQFRIAKVTISQLTEGWMYGPAKRKTDVVSG